MSRKVRMGIDVGGTHTKAVPIDNDTQQIIGKSTVKTTHDDVSGVAAGVVKAFQNCLKENNIAPEDVIFVAHSTTQATNALIEGDVAKVGVIGTALGGLEGALAKAQMHLKNIHLDQNKKIEIANAFIPNKSFTPEAVKAAAEQLQAQGAQVFVATSAFGVDDVSCEQNIAEIKKSVRECSLFITELLFIKGKALVHIHAVIAVANETVNVTQILLVVLNSFDHSQQNTAAVLIHKYRHLNPPNPSAG